jgi:uncharacterized protein YcaQ
MARLVRRRETLSNDEARRIALAAQGFADPVPKGRVDRRHLRRMVARTGAVQLDSVNVLVRSHYLPLYSRAGPYAPALIDETAYRHSELFEYWGHEASLLPASFQPLFRWRMEKADAWGGMKRVAREHPEYVHVILQEIADRGPLAAGELSDPGPRREGWGWQWTLGKRAVEWLFWTGKLAATRGPGFQRLYDIPERVLPPEVLAAPTPPVEEAQRGLLRHAGRALGVATVGDLADYFRMTVPESRPRVAELVEDGTLVPVTVDGWKQQAYLWPDAPLPRQVERRTLVSPFDSLIWSRDRTERLFGFRYRLEIFTPAPKRIHGYYVLPFLLGDRFVGRVDLKSDRKKGRLLAPAAYGEPASNPRQVASELALELRRLAKWLELDEIEVSPRGDLGPLVRTALAR